MDEQESDSESSQEEAENGSAQTRPDDNSLEANLGEDVRDPMVGQAGDALTWMEGPAFDSPIEEMPTLQWPDIEVEAQKAEGIDQAADLEQKPGADHDAGEEPGSETDDLADAMQWLEGLAKEQGTPLDEMPTLISTGKREVEWDIDGEDDQDLVEIGDTTPPPQLDSDPMAWLEQLAIDQNSPLEDLPSVADRLLASEIVSQTALEDEQDLELLTSQLFELEAALQYLEEQAAAQGIDLDDVSIAELDADDSIDEDLSALDQMVIAAAAVSATKRATAEAEVEPGDAGMADSAEPAAEDTDEALSWLSELSEESPPITESPSEPEAGSRDGAAAGEMLAEEESQDSSLVKKGLTAAAAAKVAHSLTGKEPEQSTASDEVIGVAAGEDILDSMPDDPDEALAWMGKMSDEGELEEPAASIDKASGAPLDGEVGEGKESSLLKKGAAVAGAAHLAGSLAGDEDGDHEAAGETGVIDQDVLQGMPDDPDEAIAWMAGLAAYEGASRAKEQTPAEAEETGDTPQSDRFDSARTALAAGDMDAAVGEYRALLASGVAGPELVAELETAVAARQDQPQLLQLLGDAYMQNGQQQQALKAYAQGFDQS